MLGTADPHSLLDIKKLEYKEQIYKMWRFTVIIKQIYVVLFQCVWMYWSLLRFSINRKYYIFKIVAFIQTIHTHKISNSK